MVEFIFKGAGVKWTFVYLHTRAFMHPASFLRAMSPGRSSPSVKFFLKFPNPVTKSLVRNLSDSLRLN